MIKVDDNKIKQNKIIQKQNKENPSACTNEENQNFLLKRVSFSSFLIFFVSRNEENNIYL